MNDTPTPRTDADERMAWDSEYMVPPETAREVERELTAVTEEREYWANLWADLSRACVKDTVKLQREAVTLTEQRDRLAYALRHTIQRLNDFEDYVAGGRSNPPSGNDAIDFANNAIQSLTTNEL